MWFFNGLCRLGACHIHGLDGGRGRNLFEDMAEQTKDRFPLFPPHIDSLRTERLNTCAVQSHLNLQTVSPPAFFPADKVCHNLANSHDFDIVTSLTFRSCR